MNLLDVLNKVDLELLKEQTRTVEGMIEWIDGELHLGCDEFSAERLEEDKSNLQGLLEFLDNIIIGLEEL